MAGATARTLSKLSARYNGFTLGAFLASMRDPYTSRRYSAFRRRVLEFLSEVDITVRIPRTQHAFSRVADDVLNDVLRQTRSLSSTLYDFIGLGAMAVMYASSRPLMRTSQARALRERWVPVLERHAIRSSAYDEWLHALPKTTRTTADDVLTPAALLLAYALEPLKPDNDTCFVAMPFSAPYLDYFYSLYRPALARLGMQPVRAWGGLSSEEYYLSLMTLISRSGAMLAELSTSNPNVFNEIGLAHGSLRVVFLICRRPGERVPSNLGHIPVFLYDDSKPEWPRTESRKLAKYMRWMLSEFERRYAPAYRQFLTENLTPRGNPAIRGSMAR
jgi:hypothetical protein